MIILVFDLFWRFELSKSGVGSTAEGAAFCRACEQYLPEDERLFIDPLVYSLMSSLYQWMLRSPRMRQFVINSTEKSVKGLYGEQVLRTCYIDDTLVAALKLGIRQVVILGAGIDTRAYRLPGMDQAQIFEVDMPQVQTAKKARLEKVLGSLPGNIHFIPIDFNEQSIKDVLTGSGFNPSQPAVFIWEAVTQYLKTEAVEQTLTFVGECASGSRIIFTYVLKWIIEHPERDPDAVALMKLSKMKMAPFIFGLDPDAMPEYLRRFHMKVIEDAGKETYEERYLKPKNRMMDVTTGERICTAEVSA
jgi:methyltransferase (TIGR00027 family)